jgi:hypothetical protein
MTGADAKAAYLGTCDKCPRPVRVEVIGGDGSALDRYEEIRCPDCATPLRGERLFAVESEMVCDESCMHAWGRKCTCGCKGRDHAMIWGQKLKGNELLEGQLASWREHQEILRLKREARETETAAAEAARRAAPVGSADLGVLLVHLRTCKLPDSLLPMIPRLASGDMDFTTGEAEDAIASLKAAGRR